MMEEMKGYREDIDRIDREIQRLFEERMEVAASIGAYKAARGLPVFDKAREDAKIAELRSRASDEDKAEEIAELYRTIFEISRKKQETLRVR